jgi:hypothetical protein
MASLVTHSGILQFDARMEPSNGGAMVCGIVWEADQPSYTRMVGLNIGSMEYLIEKAENPRLFARMASARGMYVVFVNASEDLRSLLRMVMLRGMITANRTAKARPRLYMQTARAYGSDTAKNIGSMAQQSYIPMAMLNGGSMVCTFQQNLRISPQIRNGNHLRISCVLYIPARNHHFRDLISTRCARSWPHVLMDNRALFFN